jgi:xanthine dehydrogenase accessory factor
VALTHDPKLDDMALLETLKSDAFYVGAAGSRSNSGRPKEHLKLFDLSDTEVERLHAPVGLHIGAQTAPEIAVAILVEMTAVCRNVLVVQMHAARNCRDSTPLRKVELWDEILP